MGPGDDDDAPDLVWPENEGWSTQDDDGNWEHHEPDDPEPEHDDADDGF
jgi:hypothetical protein